MPLDLADALYQQLLDRFPAERDYPRKALYVEGMPPLVADLLGRTLDRWLEHELDGLESKWFDFEDPAVRAARAELIVALSQTARVPRGAWAETLRYAVGLVVRHLTNPARALTDATFEGEAEELPTETVRRRLHTFKAYEYLPEIADAYLAQKRLETVDPDTLQGLLLRIDRRVTQDYGVDDWMRLLGPLFKLARRVPDVKGVPAAVLERFFAAKGQTDVAAALAEQGEKVIDESTLHKIIASALPAATDVSPGVEAEPRPVGTDVADEILEIDEEVAPEAPPPSEETEPVDHSDEDLAEAQVPDDREIETEDPDAGVSGGAIAERMSDSPAAMPAPPDEPEPLWKRFASGTVGPTVETSIPSDTTEPEPQEDDEEQPAIWRRFFSGIRRDEEDTLDSHQGAPMAASLEDLEDRLLDGITARQRRTYVRDLFRGNQDAYADVLAQIDESESWSEASQIIASEVFRRHGVDIYSDTAVSFTDRVQASFRR